MHAVCFNFCLPCSKLESVGHNEKDVIHHSRSLQMAYCTTCNSRKKRQYEDLFGYQSEYRFRFILMKTKYPVYIIGWSQAIVTLCLLSSSHIVYIKCLAEVAIPWIERVGCWRTVRLAIGLCVRSQKQENPDKFKGKFLRPPHPLACVRLTRQIAIPLIIMHEVRLSIRPTTLHTTPKMNWRQG